MFRPQALHLQNYLFWSNVTFAFEPGITLIRGENGYGKSLIFQALASTVWGVAAAKRGTDASVWPEKAKASLSFSTGTKMKWDLMNSGSRVNLHKNDENLKLPGKTALKEMRSLVPIPKDLWDATVVLSGRDPHFLTKATSSQRADWFASVFGVDVPFDAVLKKLLPLLKDAKEASQKQAVLEAELASLRIARKEISETAPLPKLKAERKALSDKLATYRGDVNSLLALVSALRSVESIRAAIANLPASDKPIEDLRLSVTKLTAQRDAVQAYEAFAEARLHASERVAKARKALAKLPEAPSASKRALKLAREAVSTAYQTNEAQRQRYEEEARFRKSATELALLKKPKQPASHLRSQIDDLKKRRARLADNSEKVCSHCGSKLSPKHRQKELKTVDAALSKLSEQLDQAIVYEKLSENAERVTIKDSPPHTAHTLALAHTELKRQINLINERADAVGALDEAKARQVEVLAASPRAVKGNLTEIKHNLGKASSRLEDAVTRAAYTQQLKRAIADLPSKAEFKDLAGAEKALATKTRLLDKAQSEHSQISDAISKRQVYADLVKSLRSRIDALKEKSKDVRMLETLVDAYGRNGLRMDHIRTLISAFEQLLNDNSALMWKPADNSEPPRFSLELDENGISIKLFRKGRVSDLSTLSGSEEKVWKLLAAYALIKLLPDKMRCDTIVLDEMETNMSATTQSRLARGFIPKLAEAGLKVIVVTPLTTSSFPVPFDRAFTVTHDENHVSSLVKGNH